MARLSSTGISKEKVLERCAKLGGRESAYHAAVKSRILGGLYREGEITLNERVFLELNNLAKALERKALTVEELNKINSKTPGEFVMVPLACVNALAASWNRYIDGPTGMTFGEAFGFEGGGQGGQNTRESISSLNQSMTLAAGVVVLRCESELASKPISLEAAYANISDKTGVSARTVRRAYNKYGKYVLEEMIQDGVINSPS